MYVVFFSADIIRITVQNIVLLNFCHVGITVIKFLLLPELCVRYFWCQFGMLVILTA
jgi:hypothetical protein